MSHWRSLPLGKRTVILGVIDIAPIRALPTGGDLRLVVEQGKRLVDSGADCLSVCVGTAGRDRAATLRWVWPAVEALRSTIEIPLQADVASADDAMAVLASGASIIRDISGARNSRVAEIAATSGAALILDCRADEWETHGPSGAIGMAAGHMIMHAEAAGMPPDAIWLELWHTAREPAPFHPAIAKRLDQLVEPGYRVVFDPRLRALPGDPPPDPAVVDDGWEGPAALLSLAIAAGIHVARVHDVGRMARVVRMADAIVNATYPRFPDADARC